MFKRKDRIQSVQAVLIEKRIVKSHDEANEIRNLYKMRWGTFNINTDKNSDIVVYFLAFMTQKGKRFFYVDNAIYHSIKIDSLGILTTNRSMFVSFDFDKIATELDVKRLGW